MSDIDCINPDDDEGHDGSVSGDSFAFQQSGDRRELPRADVHTVSIGGNVSSRLSTETHDVLDTTTVPLLRVFDRFRNLGFKRLRVSRRLILLVVNIECDRQTTPVGTAAPIIHQISVTRVDDGGCVRTNPLITASLEESFYPHAICAEGVGSHVGSPSTTGPVNHAYLSLNVPDSVIRPEIIPFPNSRLENACQSHAWGENSDTIGRMSPHNEEYLNTSMD
ncbi:hypothetical protein Tco_0960131 [Tanacetum coccineum]